MVHLCIFLMNLCLVLDRGYNLTEIDILMNISEDIIESEDSSICILSPWNTTGGVSWYTEKLAENLSNQDISVDILKMEENKDLGALQYYKLGKFLSDRYDLLHYQYTPGWYGNIAGYFWGLYLPMIELGFKGKSVLTMHEYDINERNSFIEFIQLLKNISVSNSPDKVIVHSNRAKRKLDKIMSSKNIEELFFPVDNKVELLDKEKSRKYLNIDEETNLIFNFGLISPEIDYKSLIDALSMLPENFKLIISGGTRNEAGEETKQKLKEKTEEMEKIKITNFIPEKDLPEYYAASDITVFPRKEGAESSTIATSMAYEKPIVVPDLEAVKGKPVFKYNKEDSKSLRDAFLSALKDDRKKQISRYKKEHSWSKFVKEHKRIYNQLQKS